MTVYVLIALLGVIVVAWFIHASRPLTSAEIEECARRKRLLAIEAHYSFNDAQVAVNLKFKSSMSAAGELYPLDESVSSFPATAAGLLKWKKHEWIVFAFSRADRVIAAWMNKGPDNEKAWPLVNLETLVVTAKQLKAETVLDFHNHPNPDPRSLRACLPSPQDHIHANYFGSSFVARGITYLAFVAERGRHFQYACWVPDSFCPLEFYLADVRAWNGASRLDNFRLRSLYRARSRLTSLLQYKDASENLGILHHHRTAQLASLPAVAHPPQRESEPEPAPRPTPRPGHRPSLMPVQSSYLLAVGYDPKHQLLEVAFRNGSVYQYFGIPENEYQGLMAAPSKGRYFNAHIVAGAYDYVQVA